MLAIWIACRQSTVVFAVAPYRLCRNHAINSLLNAQREWGSVASVCALFPNEQTMSAYLVRKAPARLILAHGWNDEPWSAADTLDVAAFRVESSAHHRPGTQARLLYAGTGLFGIFRVEDRFVRCTQRQFQDPVYRDSCVEIFLQPKREGGYVNVEMAAGGGAVLVSHVTDERRTASGFAGLRSLAMEETEHLRVRSTLPPVVEPEMVEPVTWELAFFVPIAMVEGCVGPIGALAGQEWRANLYKCGDDTSHPHWAAWSPVDELNFHLPRCFGTLQFEP